MSLCNKKKTLPEHARKHNNKFHNSSQARVISTGVWNKETRSCACRKGSFTLEAAVVLPLLAGFFSFLLFFFRVMQVQTAVQSALYYAGRKTACEACMFDSPSALLALAEGHFQKEVRKYPLVKEYVAGGNLGVSLLESDFSGNYIALRTNYYIKSKINIIPFRGIYISQGAKCRKWTDGGAFGGDEVYVYVTEYGTVYHLSRQCHYLDLSIHTAEPGSLSSLRNQEGRRYDACMICTGNAEKSSVYYITDYGDCYHSSLSCAGLKRTIYLIPLSEVGEKGPCTKCGMGLTSKNIY